MAAATACGEEYMRVDGAHSITWYTYGGTVEDILAEVDLGISAAEAEVLWENRRVPLSGGRLRDDFVPYAVHVYRLDCQRTERSTQ